MGETINTGKTEFICQLALPRTFFGGDVMGDLGLTWSAENVDKVVPTLQKLIDDGVNFYLVEKSTGLVRSKTTVHVVDGGATLGSTVKDGRVFIKNADIKALVDSGIASIATLEGVADFKVPKGAKAKTGQEAATNDTVALGQRTGG